MKFHTVERLGPKQSLTPEGFLLCEDVPIARTGVMIYSPQEVPITAGPDGLIRIRRDEEHVFAEAHIASYAGKDLVDDHPDGEVNPDNWTTLSMGIVLNPRRGTGILADFLIADILVKAPSAIKAIREDGKVEVSCGYNADYLEVEPGHGKQVNMLGNHVALVDAGRCGPRCAIRDQDLSTLGGIDMRFNDESIASRITAKLRKAFTDKDETAFNGGIAELDALPIRATKDDGGIAIHLHSGPSGTSVQTDEEATPKPESANDRGMSDAEKSEFEGFKKKVEGDMKAIMDALTALSPKAGDAEADPDMKEDVPAGTEDAVMKAARDSALLVDSFQQTAAGAEILVPGIFVPELDEKAEPKKTYDSIIGLRRNALQLFSQGAAGAMLAELHGKPVEFDKLSTKDARSLFNSAVAVQKVRNNTRVADLHPVAVVTAGKKQQEQGKRISSIAELNERNRLFYAPDKAASN